MPRRAIVVVVGILVVGYSGTWLWAHDNVEDVLVKALKSKFAKIQTEHGSHLPMPHIEASINWSVPVLPGVVLVNYVPMAEGRAAACFDYHAIVLWYGVGGKLLFDSPAPDGFTSSTK